MDIKYNISRTNIWFSVVGIGLLVVFSFPFIDDLLLLDEAIFAQTMRSFAEAGSFRYYAGVTRGWQTGLWHPPTYVIYGAVWSIVFGASSVIFRTATLLFTLLTVPLVGILASHLYPHPSRNGSGQRVVASAILLYVTSPLVVQNAALIDIDGSLLALAVTAFVTWTIVTFESKGPNRITLYLGIAVWFAAISWIKFGVLPVLLVSTVAFVWLKLDFRRAVFVSIAAVSGFALFTLTWWIVAQTFGFSFLTPFLHNFGSLLEGGSHIQMQKRLLLSAWATYVEILWISPFLIVLAALVTVGGYESRKRTLREYLAARAPYVFCTSISLLTLLQYAVLAKVPYGFPKYLGIASPLLCAVAATSVPRVTDVITTQKDWILTSMLVILVAVMLLFVGDPFLVSFNEGYLAVFRRSALTVAGFVGAAVVVGTLLWRWNQDQDRRHLLVLLLMVLLLGSHVGVLTIQMTSDYSTRYNYGQSGTVAAVDATKAAYSSIPSEHRREAVLPRDFAFYVDGEFQIVREYSVTELEREKPPLVVLRTRKYYAVDSPIFRALRASEEYEMRRYGSYVLFVKKG